MYGWRIRCWRQWRQRQQQRAELEALFGMAVPAHVVKEMVRHPSHDAHTAATVREIGFVWAVVADAVSSPEVDLVAERITRVLQALDDPAAEGWHIDSLQGTAVLLTTGTWPWQALPTLSAADLAQRILQTLGTEVKLLYGHTPARCGELNSKRRRFLHVLPVSCAAMAHHLWGMPLGRCEVCVASADEAPAVSETG